MKSSAPESMKFKRLQRRLQIGRKETVGILELLWLATAKNAPQGDIGRFSNEEIAIECDWEGDHDELVAALVLCGWLDEHTECRLYVHDWHDHAPSHIANNLKRWGKGFIATKESPKEVTKESAKDGPTDCPGDVPPSLAKPSQAKPSVAKSNQTNAAAAAWAADAFKDLDFEEVKRQAEKLYRCKPSLSKDFVWQVCVVGQALQPGLVGEWIQSVAEPGKVSRPRRYLEVAAGRECESRGFTWNDACSRVPKGGAER